MRRSTREATAPLRLTLLALAAIACVPTMRARAQTTPSPWRVGVAAGDDAWVAGRFGQHGFVLLDARRDGVARGRVRLLFNTDTLQAGLEGIRLADGKLELGIVARGEALLAGLLFDYYQGGERNGARAFYASYVQLLPSLKWHPRERHSIELVAGIRQWFFGRGPSTADTFRLPSDTFVAEPRLSYTYWRIRAASREWEPHRLHPRITGVALGVTLGLDRRRHRDAWGADVGGGLDPRNRPGEVVLTARQWLYAGADLGPVARLQLEQHASYGAGEDDITRSRLGGMNPYVFPIAGLPWAAILAERAATLHVALHLRPRQRSPHELGFGIDSAVFSDPRRIGALSEVGAAASGFVFGDFRIDRLQLHGRVGYALPMEWLSTRPNVSFLLTAGYRIR